MEALFEATRKATADLRQKDPLSHRRRRRQRPNNPMGGMGGMSVHEEMKGMLGELGPEEVKKADSLWKMLDNMYENDPEEYKNFIETQMKLGEEHKQQEEEKNKNGNGNTGNTGNRSKATASGVSGAASAGAFASSSSSTRTFQPNGIFVVKAYGRYLKNKIFLNICCHRGVQKPMGASGKEVQDNTQPHLARQIPLLVGVPREVKDVAGVGCTAIDVVFNPWVTNQAEHNTMFKSQVVDLAMKWVSADYPDIKFDNRWKTPNSKYKGGTGLKGNVPLPFPMDVALNQSNSDYNNEEGKKSDSGNGGGGNQNKTKTTNKPSFSVDPLSSPASLLAETRRAAEDQESSINLAPPKAPTSTSKSLIQEMDKHGQVVKTKKNKKKKKKVVKKGFLNSTKDIDLYGPEGSNEDGFVTGRPKKGSLMDRCKVVDTRYMDQETLDDTMKEYAETGTSSAPGKGPRTKPTTKTTTKPTTTTKTAKTATTKPATTKRATKSTSKAKQVRQPHQPTKQEEDEFDRLMAMADPEALSDAMSNVLSMAGGDAGLDALGLGEGDVEMMQKLLFGAGGGPGMEGGEKKKKKKVPSSSSSADEIDVNAISALKGKFNLPKLNYTMATATNKKKVPVVQVVVTCPPGSNFEDMELDLSDTTMKLKIASARMLVVKFNTKCLSTQAKAKLKKNSTLVVSIPIA